MPFRTDGTIVCDRVLSSATLITMPEHRRKNSSGCFEAFASDVWDDIEEKLRCYWH